MRRLSLLRSCRPVGGLGYTQAVRAINGDSIRCFSVSSTRPPVEVGSSVGSIDTPALVLSMEAFEANCRRLQDAMSSFPHVHVRPHAKAHKVPEIARLQLALLGSRGVCCQKVSEAEAMFSGGVTDLMVTNEVVAPAKIKRLVGLAASGARVSVAVDHADNARCLGEEARRAGTQLEALVEVNIGQDRCGVDTPEEAVRLAQAVAGTAGLRLAGVLAYQGALQHVRQPQERAARVAQAIERAAAAVDAIRGSGLEVAVVTGGGTGTFRLEAASGVYTEVQPGSFAFGDADYARNVQADGSVGEWQQSLWVHACVVSASSARRSVVLDAGSKALALESAMPAVPEGETGGVPTEFQAAGDEHSLLLWPEGVYQLPREMLPVGSVVRVQPGHVDPTFNLYDWVVATRADRVEAVWEVRGRGPGA